MRCALSLVLLAATTGALTGCQSPQPRAPVGAAGASTPATEWLTQWPPQPQVRAGDAVASVMPHVHTLAELKAQMPIRVSDD